MGLTTRFLLLFASLFGLFLAGVLLLDRVEARELARQTAITAREGADNLARLHALEGKPLLRFASDYSWWDDTVNFIARPDPDWARINYADVMEFHDINVIQVYDPHGTLVYGVTADNSPAPPLDVAALLVRSAHTPFGRFHLHADEHLWELYLAPIQPSDDLERRTEPAGWFLAGRLWDETRQTRFSEVIGGTARWQAHPPAPPPPPDGMIRHVITLHDLGDQPTAWLELTQPSVALSTLAQPRNRLILTFLLYGFVLLGVLVYAVQGWVLRPLRQIGVSLRSRQVADLAPLRDAVPQLARLADELGEAFAQRLTLEHESEQRRVITEELRTNQAALEEAVAQRSQLSRDLHDHIIQSLYAIGMGLAAIRSLLPRECAGMEPRIQQLQDTLNNTIRQLRAFITELEPEPVNPGTLGQAVRELLDAMQVMRPFAAEVAVPDGAAATLPASTRAHLLQIAREAVSNALRHGHAERIHIILDHDAVGRTRLRIEDNGGGFDPAAIRPGRGLVNLRERARLINATLDITAQVGHGTCLTLTFVPIPPLSPQ
jgi:signal transduction histidine kinase